MSILTRFYRPVITDPISGKKRCVYCDEQDPSDDHVEVHNYKQCEEKGLDARTFYRKDHLRQHLRLMHSCEMTPFMDNWKSVAVNINSRCGFCAQRFTVWQERVDHLTAHFKVGAKMSEWKGCRGLDPAVAAQVTNAMPPYLIGVESVSPNPFSASNKATWRPPLEGENETMMPELGNLNSCNLENQDLQSQETGLPSKATCWEILTVRLGRYANRMSAQGIVLTDEMLQSEARQILYDSDDAWNQTAADNPEWLDLFKKAHGLDFIPNAVGGQGHSVPDDLETYGDLGLRVPFSVQLQALNQSHAEEEMRNTAANQGQRLHSKPQSDDMKRIWATLSKEGVLHDVDGKCKHTECEDNILDSSLDQGRSSAAPKLYRWCTYELPPQKAKEIAQLTAPLVSQGKLRAKVDGNLESSDQDWNRQNVFQGLESLINMENEIERHRDDGRPSAEHDRQIEAARAKSRALEALTYADCVGNTQDCTPLNAPAKRPFVPRHRYQLPARRAQQFATTTGPWEDSGSMPAPISTASIDLGPNITSTGAMMEFLGPELGGTLPFSTDAETSTIPITSNFNWDLPTSTADEAAMMQDVDRLIAETTLPQSDEPVSAEMFGGMTSSADATADLTMNDVNFDMDFDFDGVFDMPMDETFGPQQG